MVGARRARRADARAVEGHAGTVVKMTGDGVHAAFDDALDALAATSNCSGAGQSAGYPRHSMRVRCGLHAGVVERRDNDSSDPVNRAARIMSAAHGGQVLLSQAVVDDVRDRLPAAVSLRDLGRVRLRDLSASERVYQVVHPQLRQEFPALRSLEATPNNLPQQATTFVGREKEMAELRRLLEEPRLLTLTGSGGCGKTRLRCRWPPTARALPRRRVAGGTRAARGPGSRSADGGDVLGLKEEPGKPIARPWPSTSRTSGCCCCSTTASTCSTPALSWPTRFCAVPASADPRHQPGSAGHRRRAVVPRALARAARSAAGAHTRTPRAVRGRAAVRRSRAARPRRFRGHRPERRRARLHLPSAGRHPPGHRAGGGAGAIPVGRRDHPRLDQRFRLLTGGLAYGAAAPADAALADRLELRPAERARAGAVARLSVSPAAGRWRRGAGLRRRRRRASRCSTC